jgi:hypothetical protein
VFTITHNTVRRFTLTEILLMAAMNQTEATRKVGGSESVYSRARHLGWVRRP